MAQAQLERTDAPCKPTYRRLNDADRVLAIQLREHGKTQTEIAQQLGVSQQAISLWLTNIEDTTNAASLYFRGSALRMARNVVQRGKPKDHNDALAGIGVLSSQDTRGNITIVVGAGAAVQVNIGTAAEPALSPLSTSMPGEGPQNR